MTLLIIAVSALSVACFAVGWLRGYKKACDAHNWSLPRSTGKATRNAPRGRTARLTSNWIVGLLGELAFDVWALRKLQLATQIAQNITENGNGGEKYDLTVVDRHAMRPRGSD